MHKRNKLLFGLMIVAALISYYVIGSVAAANEVEFTSQNVDFYGYCEGIKVGDLITVYDQDGVLCGKFKAEKSGMYGIVHVYGDDPTSDTDEGAEEGDFLAFYLNGKEIFPKDGRKPVWTKDGDSFRMDF